MARKSGRTANASQRVRSGHLGTRLQNASTCVSKTAKIEKPGG